MVKVSAEDVKLVMWKKLEMPERNYNQETKSWEKTGNLIWYTLKESV